MLAVYGPHSQFWHKAKKQFFDQIWCFYSKSKILTIFFIVKFEKSTLFDEFLVLLGSIISWFFACSNEEKINRNNKGCVLQSYLYGSKALHMLDFHWCANWRITFKIRCPEMFTLFPLNSVHFTWTNFTSEILLLTGERNIVRKMT